MVASIKGGAILMHKSAPISGVAAMVYNMVHDDPINHHDDDDTDDEIWKRLFHSYRNFMQKQMKYNMHLIGK